MKQYKILTLLTALCALFYASCVEYEDPALYTPTVTTGSVDPFSITRTEATVTATITSPNVKTIKVAGFRYSQFETLEAYTEVRCNIEGQGIKASLSNLKTDQTYYYYAFASGNFNEVQGQIGKFTTEPYGPPSIGKVTLANISESSLQVTSSLIDNGGDDLGNAGFIYRVCSMSEPDPVPSLTGEGWQVAFYKNFASISNGSSFSNLIENLVPDTEYALCAFATNKATQTGYSEVVRFRTSAPAIGEITMSEVTAVSAIATASITDKGNTDVSLSGFCLSKTNTKPDLYERDQIIPSNSTSGSGSEAIISAKINGLEENTTYYLRAFVINAVGILYSSTKEFVTNSYGAPTVAAVEEESARYKEKEVTVSSSISYNGGFDVTERGFCFSRTNSMPTLADDHIVATGSDESFQATITNLELDNTYYVRAYATNERGASYSNSALEVRISVDPFNGHDYVDLGLKDSEGNTIYWATCNVGADTPEDYGLYFAWGETVGYARNDSHVFDWAHYSLCGGSSITMKKYCIDSNFGTVDNKTVLEPEDDAATQNWGGNWRIPIEAEQDQLRRSCTWTWNSTKKGYTVTGTNGNSIFLPATGYRYGSDLIDFGSDGYYWSSSLYTSSSDYAYGLGFFSSLLFTSYNRRYYGKSVRAVCVSIE